MQQQFLSVSEEQIIYVRLGDRTYKVRLFSFRELMYIDIIWDDEYVVAGQRVMANSWLIPEYKTGNAGNFRFETYKADGDDYVWWEGFNVKFRLCCYSREEIARIEAGEKIDDGEVL